MVARDSLILAKAEQHIAESERRVSEQEILLDKMRRTGMETGEAERLLANLRGLLEQFRSHRGHLVKCFSEP